MLGHLVGLVKVRVTRGVNLAIRDLRSSDPYVVVRMGKQKLKTRVVRKSINPEWNDELTLSVEDPTIPVKLTSSRNGDWMRDSCLRTSSLLLVPVQDVFDKDTFFDDPMGNAELDIGPLGVADGTVVKKLVPNRQNCLAEESAVYLSEGTVKQDVVLRLRNVECGEVELQLQWIDIPGSKGASGF
ncbi:ADP-ribosylation factor GTPase-activating protein AGD12 [Triticum urartu]|uniref:ADP-ribosylation factor GTPase-activating protein AGD12 n=1 Tax=Triticum urartu TaxID=4572 RepID=M7ZFB2_TRIUA|nr:ADP-ribosylation factor GTPase-activating protein AGD12 [Triticum urartu]